MRQVTGQLCSNAKIGHYAFLVFLGGIVLGRSQLSAAKPPFSAPSRREKVLTSMLGVFFASSLADAIVSFPGGAAGEPRRGQAWAPSYR